MKTTIIRRARGFTLIELLVVITIIAVLATLGFSAGNAAIQRAKKTTALNVATAIEQAVNNFFNEYGYLPYDGAASADTVIPTNNAAGAALLLVLSGKETSDTPLNTKSISFLSIKEGKGDVAKGRDGLIYVDSTPTAIFDPWGGPYYVALNTDYSDSIPEESITPKVGTKKDLNAKNVAVWTNGADGVIAGAGQAADDVTTW